MKVVFVISQVDRWMTFEWMAEGLRKDFDLHFVLLNPGESYFEDYLKQTGFPVQRINFRGKADVPLSILRLQRLLRNLKPEVVHTHFLDANLVGLTAAWLARIPKRIYTRHHSVFHHRYSKKGVWYDRLSNLLCTHVIAISQKVRRILEKVERVPSSKISVIHHGFDLSQFKIENDRFGSIFLKNHEIPVGKRIVGVISRYIEWKGIAYIIEAFKSFQKTHPEAFLLLLNARGPDNNQIQKALKVLPKDSYAEIPFEKNILSVYPILDVLVHVPIDEEVEAFGQVYVEALAAGVPSVFTLSGVASEFVQDRINALVVPYQNAKAIEKALNDIWNNTDLRAILQINGFESAKQFGIDHFCDKLKSVYEA